MAALDSGYEFVDCPVADFFHPFFFEVGVDFLLGKAGFDFLDFFLHAGHGVLYGLYYVACEHFGDVVEDAGEEVVVEAAGAIALYLDGEHIADDGHEEGVAEDGCLGYAGEVAPAYLVAELAAHIDEVLYAVLFLELANAFEIAEAFDVVAHLYLDVLYAVAFGVCVLDDVELPVAGVFAGGVEYFAGERAEEVGLQEVVVEALLHFFIFEARLYVFIDHVVELSHEFFVLGELTIDGRLDIGDDDAAEQLVDTAFDDFLPAYVFAAVFFVFGEAPCYYHLVGVLVHLYHWDGTQLVVPALDGEGGKECFY